MKSEKRQPSKLSALHQIIDSGIPVKSIVDVGIHHATSELMKSFPTQKHYLFEPVSEHFEQINANYTAAGINYELNPVAVSDRDGVVDLELTSITSDAAVTHSNIVTGSSPTGAVRQVPTVKLDTFVSENKVSAPYLMKIDVDGAEDLVLAGARRALEQCSILIVEAARDKIPERIATVTAAGFEMLDIVDICYNRGYLWQVDLVFINPSFATEGFASAFAGPETMDDWRSLKLQRPPLIERGLRKLKNKLKNR